MRLVGFIIRIYHDARSPEHQIRHAVLIIKPTRCTNFSRTPDDGQRNSPKHVNFYSKNKFEKLVHLVGFVIRIYHDARSPERQISHVVLIIKPTRCTNFSKNS